MDEIWTRLETFLQQNAPQIYEGLAPGATEAEIAETESRTGFPFPADVRRSYLRHNGQMLATKGFNMSVGGEFIPGSFGLWPLAQVSDLWEFYYCPGIDAPIADDEVTDPRVKRVFLDRAWVGFAWDIGGNAICLDFEPRPSGRVGQVVLFDHEAAMRQWLAPSFRVWLEMIVSDLETGRLVWNAELNRYEYPKAEEEGAAE